MDHTPRDPVTRVPACSAGTIGKVELTPTGGTS